MKSNVNISIPKPCAENWDAMLPEEKGRHCLACNKLITDFSTKTDQEILDYIKANNGKVCGRFNESQLDRNLVAKEQHTVISLWHKVAASLLFFIGINEASANNISVHPSVINIVESKIDTDKNIHREPSSAKADNITISGKVVDDRTKDPIPFVTVLSEKYKIHAQSDFDGNFKIKIPIHDNIETIELTFKVIGYEIKNVNYPLANFNNSKVIEGLNPSILLKETSLDYVIMGMVINEPIKKKWYQFWK